MTGTLVLVATPIGNLGDLSPRAVEELDAAALVCCEDTRRTGRLLVHAGIGGARLRRVDDHTEMQASAEVIALLASGARVALVSDAGTPGISDPGARLVDAVLDAGHEVSVVPGPVAAVAALVASGLPTDRFVFEGFLPRKGRERRERLASIAAERRTVVLYESPNRVATALTALAEVCGGDRRAVVARELTKLHEEFVRGTLTELGEWAATTPKGEIVVVIDGAAAPAEATDEEILSALGAELADGGSRRDAADSVAAMLGVGRRRAYQLALGIPGGVTPPS
ncbi:MAG: 16S rRNA (cytidine(1402)-2'-O)-methyltransferase [Acidimicrobiales bacterium]